MTVAEKRFKELQSKIISDNSKIISSAIISLRNEEHFNGAVGLLAELFDKSDDVFIKDLIRNFFNDTKESAARPEIVAELHKNHKSDTISMLAASCWQSGLDYSEYAADFSEVFISSDYLAALECFTVLEESVSNIPFRKKEEITRFLTAHKAGFPEDKSKLLEALINILS